MDAAARKDSILKPETHVGLLVEGGLIFFFPQLKMRIERMVIPYVEVIRRCGGGLLIIIYFSIFLYM